MIGEAGQAFAVIADIHGNADALRAVLSDIDARAIGELVNLGDHFSGPLAARETAEILMARDIITIRGNHDRWLVEMEPAAMGASDRAAFDALEPAHLAWLCALPATLHAAPDILLCHGTPDSDTTYWLEHLGPDGLPNRRPLGEISGYLADPSAGLILCGHTHIPRRVDVPGGPVIFNPGSVGCPGYDDDTPFFHVMEAATPAAAYGIVTRTQAGWRTEIHHVPYDTARMAAFAEAAGRAEWARALRTGFVTA
ncbi:metallophosphoesterase family protein [Acuticoccus sp. MNP-M23]|uniref:metallophosphoesterase family protein n=1 Tax=Acuticoccus sp. MNP-M23 TaxID=3072793 RepID=UPI002815D291|nr:metallophosphoesterase family protein [Acuticoccus sp. MNP-M23]WMS41561.1 metallophosphoesterase family protein [Acuticoccus sp. MNP-M23]